MLQTIDYHAILPELILAGAAVLVLVVDLFVAAPRKWIAMPLSLLGVGGAFAALVSLVDGGDRATFCLERVTVATGLDDCSYVVDDFAVIMKMIFLGSAFVVLLLSLNHFKDERYYQGEYYFLLLCAFFGMLTMASSRDLIMLFISLEIVSVPGFVIAGFRKADSRSTESAIKFFLIGVLSTAVMLFGMSIVYGMTGSVHLNTIAAQLDSDGFVETPAMAAAVALVVVGFAFKVSAAPFHFWAPDTYQGAPVPVAAFLSVASKAAGFTGLIVVCAVGLRPYAHVWGPLLAILAAMTMTLGNLVAVQQRQMVRLLAYSSIGQAGYMLVPLSIAATAKGRTDELMSDAVAATVAYIAIYAVLNLGVFACVIAVARRTPRNLVADYRGLSRISPLLAAAVAFFMLGLAGVPPALAGLIAKFYVFRTAIDGEMGWLAAVMAVNTVVAAWYYLRIAFTVFAGVGEPAGEAPLGRPRVPAAVVTAIVIALVAAVAIGFAPDLVFDQAPRLAIR